MKTADVTMIFFSSHDRLLIILVIPPVYEVYRGYIVFAFPFVCECVCVNFFSSKISQQLLGLGF